jgi:hypothetical protein
MPADVPGITTDDQSQPERGDQDRRTGAGRSTDGALPDTEPAADHGNGTAAGAGDTTVISGPGVTEVEPTAPLPATGADEVPPPPVLAPGPAPARRPRGRGRGRHLRARRDRRADRRGLRVTQRLWSIDVWSVFKISALFYLCLALIVLVAGTLLYNAGRRVGTIDQLESFVSRMAAYGECVPQTEVEEGVEFEEDDDCGEGEVLVGGFKIDDGTLFRVAAVSGGILVVAGSIGNVLMTVLLNLLTELTGGLRHTIVREPVGRRRGEARPRAPGPDAPAPGPETADEAPATVGAEGPDGDGRGAGAPTGRAGHEPPPTAPTGGAEPPPAPDTSGGPAGSPGEAPPQ